MANDRDRLEILKKIQQVEGSINRARESTVLTQLKINKYVDDQKKKIVELGKELKKVNQTSLESYGGAEQSIGSISGIYKNLQDSQRKGLKLQQDTFAAGSEQEKSALKISGINRQISELSADETVQRAALVSLRDEEMKSVSKGLHGNTKVLQNLKEQNKIAIDNSNLTEDEIASMKKIEAAQDALKSSMQAITETAETFVTNLKSANGITGLLLIGGGKFLGKLSEVNKELGQVGESLSGAAGSATVLSFAFDDSAQTLKSLSAEMGGLEDATFGAQLQTNLMANNLGISGAEAATLSGSLARLNGGSLETAGNLAAGSREFARMNNIPVSQLMGDVAGSTEEFALFGKDGGKNILQAAGYAAKLGSNMSTISGIADGLLDFESSITKELELGAMLGKNINLDKARQLAMEGDLEGMMKETLSSLGGIDAFNKMDYFQKKATADLLGVSVAELGKMAINQEKAQNVSKLMNGDFSNIGESLKAIVADVGPKMMSWAGGFLTMSSQAGQTWTAFGGGISKTLGKLKGFLGLGKKAAGAATSIAGSATESVAGNVGTGGGVSGALKGSANPAGRGGIMSSMSKVNMGSVLKGAAAMVLIAGSLFILGKALQEFKTVGGPEIGMAVAGIVLLGLTMMGLGALFTGPQAILILNAAAGMFLIGAAVAALGFGINQLASGFKTFGEIAPILGGLVSMVGGLFMLSSAFTLLAGSLALLGLAGITALPALLGLGIAGAGLGMLFGAFGGDDSSSSEVSSVEDESLMFISEQITTGLKGVVAAIENKSFDVYMDGAKLTSVLQSRVSKVGSNTYSIK